MLCLEFLKSAAQWYLFKLSHHTYIQRYLCTLCIFNSRCVCCAMPATTMGWLPLIIGSLKLHVSFAKEPYKRDDILQKRPILFRSLLIVATPYASNYCNQQSGGICSIIFVYVCVYMGCMIYVCMCILHIYLYMYAYM